MTTSTIERTLLHAAARIDARADAAVFWCVLAIAMAAWWLA